MNLNKCSLHGVIRQYKTGEFTIVQTVGCLCNYLGIESGNY